MAAGRPQRLRAIAGDVLQPDGRAPRREEITMPLALRTPRLLLREWQDAEREPLAAMWSDPEVMAFYAAPLADRAASDAWIAGMQAHFARNGFAYWAAELPGEARLVGAVGMTRVGPTMPFGLAVEIGWRLARAYLGEIGRA